MSPPKSYAYDITTGSNIVHIIPSDDPLTNGECRALWIGNAGNLNITVPGHLSGTGPIERDDVPATTGLFPVRCTHVRAGATETAASNIWAIY